MLMSLVGMGRAFNLRFMPNGPLRTNCYHRPMPHVGLFGGGGNFSYTENVNIQNGPSGFWGFMTGLTQGLFGGGMFGMGMGGGIFGLLNSRQAATPQGPSQTQGEDAHLKNLTDFYGKSYIIKSHPDKDGIYQAVPKDGGKPIEGTYDELMEKLASGGSEPTVAPTAAPSEAPTAAPTAAPSEAPTAAPTAAPSEAPTESPTVSPTDGSRSRAGVSGGRRSASPDGWYRAEQNNQDGKAVLKAIRPGMSARQVTDIILNNKVNYLSPEDRNKLAKDVERNNPSVFQDGKVKEGFDPSKLDIPSIDYIKKNYVGSGKDIKATKKDGTKKATGKYNGASGEHKIGQTITGKTGRYAKQIDGRWHYFAKDGTELNEATIRQRDPDLFAKTIAEQRPKMNSEGNNVYSVQIKTMKGTRTYRVKANNPSEAKDKLRAKIAQDGYNVYTSSSSNTFTVQKQ